MNKSEEVLFSIIDGYIKNLKTCDVHFRNNTFDKNIKKEILSNMEETAGKLMLACRDLKKEMEK